MDNLKLNGKTNESLDLLTQAVRIFSSNICMEFEIEKCNILIRKKGIKDEAYNVMSPNNLKIF